MMNGSSSTVTIPPQSAHSTSLPLVELEEGSYTDGTTFYIYDSSLLQSVLQGIGVSDSESVTLTVAGADDEGISIEGSQKILKLEIEPPKVEPNTQEQPLMQIKLEETESEYSTSNGITESEPNNTEPLLLPTFYNDMAIALSNDVETHETYLPLSFDEASHFLFHGREECVISTDIPTVESSSLSMTTNTNTYAGINGNNISNKVPTCKPTPAKRQRLNEGETITRKVFKCPYSDCNFWAARGHRFHEHMCTHDTVRPFGCSECTYETNWKSDVKKHIARMIQRNAQDHENAVLTKVTEKKVDINNYKEYMVNLDVPCYMYSGRVGQPSRSSFSNNGKANSANISLDTDTSTTDYNDLILLPSSSSSASTPSSSISEVETPKRKKPKASRPPKPIVRVTRILPDLERSLSSSAYNDNSISENNVESEVIISDFFSTTEEVIETTLAENKVQNVKNPVLQRSITTGDGTIVNIFSEAQCHVAKVKKAAPNCTVTSTSQSIISPIPRKSSPKKPKENELWKCTNCTFTHSNKSTVFNHLYKFHKLLGNLAKPMQVTSSLSIPFQPSKIDSLSIPSPQGYIVKGEEGESFNQYFLVVNNYEGAKPETVTRISFSPEHKCDICPFVTKDGHEIIAHREFHTGGDENLTYTCPYCSFKSATRKDMEQHKLLHSNVNGRTVKLNDYSRINIKKCEEEKKEAALDTLPSEKFLELASEETTTSGMISDGETQSDNGNFIILQTGENTSGSGSDHSLFDEASVFLAIQESENETKYHIHSALPEPTHA